MMHDRFSPRAGATAKNVAASIAALSIASLLSVPFASEAFADTADEAVATLEAKSQLIEGTTISVMGDSISIYAGWSDSAPIASEDCAYRYGEAYYGPAGGDYHNTDLLVTDTWWHQAAGELGGEILVSNAANSTGLLHASYPSNAEWEQYLQDLLAYKSRPYYLGVGEEDPDIIALYIGSNDVAKAGIDRFGSVGENNFEALIMQGADGEFEYAEPSTVAEAYSILLHKISVEYPNAETYCFTVVPNSGGSLETCNKRLEATYPFNEMIKEVAAHYGVNVVDLFAAFGLDSDGDGLATQEEFDTFKTYFNGDPHPNAAGFDVIADCFVSSVLANSEYVAEALAVEDSVEGEEAAQADSAESMVYVNNEAELTGGNGLIAQGVERVVIPETPDIASGYEFEYVGSDKLSNYWAAELIADEAQSYEGQGPIYSSEDGEVNLYSQHPLATLKKRGFLVPRLYLGLDESVEGSYAAQYDSVQQFVLVDKAGNPITVYCADLLTSGVEGYDYVVKDIESASYYSEEDAAMIRAIALNGYWGTDPGNDEEPAFGSLASIKKMMADSGKFTDDEIDKLNDGMAMTATQYAIWTYSNSLDKRTFVNAYYTTKPSLSKGFAAPESDVDLIFKLYRHLITLSPMTIEGSATDNTVIEAESFLVDASASVTGKPMEHPANQDEDDANDAYTVDLSLVFDVAVKAGNGDDLVVSIANGNEVIAVGRIAGELVEGEQQLSFENGRYVVSGLVLQEGNTENMRIVMSGTQNLSKGVYLFESESREMVADSDEMELVSSQSMIGVAEGVRSVNAVSCFALELDVTDEPVNQSEHGSGEAAGEMGGEEGSSQTEGAGSLDASDEPLENGRMTETEAPVLEDSGNLIAQNDGKSGICAQTGDEVNVGMWMALMLASIAAIVAGVVRRRMAPGRK